MVYVHLKFVLVCGCLKVTKWSPNGHHVERPNQIHVTHKKVFASLFLNINYVITKYYPEV